MVLEYLNKYSVHYHSNQGITICNVADIAKGVELVKGMLYDIVDRKTVLYLSGGSMQTLYEQLAKEEMFTPGAIGLIDERFGEPMHLTSNEKMISETRILKYFTYKDIPFYPILQKGKSREEVSTAYDEKVRSLQATYRNHIGLIGIGPDGHISSIIPNRSDFHNPWFDPDRANLLVSEFNDPTSHYKERVGMTFLGLSMLDFLIVPVFGDSKQPMFEALFSEGSEQDIPARFFKRPEIAKKTFFVTDQEV